MIHLLIPKLNYFVAKKTKSLFINNSDRIIQKSYFIFSKIQNYFILSYFIVLLIDGFFIFYFF